ncbi:hypothetical protein [Streptomyces sp. H27-D2]|uniref:hypothetical protein n=1 Tax=Streptomyces sp. H27-D2 TaxID=3046304 RepID=UPI003FA6E25F
MPEEYGGVGGGALEVHVVMEELGAVAGEMIQLHGASASPGNTTPTATSSAPTAPRSSSARPRRTAAASPSPCSPHSGRPGAGGPAGDRRLVPDRRSTADLYGWTAFRTRARQAEGVPQADRSARALPIHRDRSYSAV